MNTNLNPIASVFIRGLFLVAIAIPVLGQPQGILNGFMTGIRVNTVKGPVSIHRGDASFDLEAGLKLEQDDFFKSGPDAFYELLLQPGSYLRSGANTELHLLNDQIDRMKLKLNQGAICFEIVLKDNSSNYYNPREAYELIRVLTRDAEVFVNGAGIFRINARPDGRTELIVRNGDAVINGQRVKKNQRAITSGNSVSVSELDVKSEDNFDVWARERADTLVRANKSLKNNSPWGKREKGVETSVDLPEDEQRSSNPFVVSAKPGAVNFVEPGVEFSRPKKEWEQLTEKSQLEAGDAVRTSEHSFAELMLFPDVHFRLDQDSEVVFEQLSNDAISLKLLRGSAILDVAKFDRKQSPQITFAGPAGAAVVADRGNYRIDLDAIAVREGKVIFNERSVGSCRRISGGNVSECDKKRTDNFDFWSRHRGEGEIYNGTATVTMVTYFARLRQQRFRKAGFWFQNYGQPDYTFVPFTSLLFRSPYGGSYSTVLSPDSYVNRLDTRQNRRVIQLPGNAQPQSPPQP